MNISLVTSPMSFANLPANSIALDGAVRGTHLDYSSNRWSFDHHAGDQHSISTRSTALQTLLALRAGLDVSTINNVFVSSVDADSVIATALLMRPELRNRCEVITLVTLHLDTVDSMGPVGALSPSSLNFHYSLRAGYKQELTTELLLEKVEYFYDLLREERLFESTPEEKNPVTLVSISLNGDVQMENGEFGFSDLYSKANIGILHDPDGTRTTIGIKSSFVSDKHLLNDGLFDKLNAAEINAGAATNEDGTIESGWGGKDLVGGSPFQGKTLLSINQITEIVCNFLKE
jgi:hypothetical protein